jgi:MoaA/NifB/PqqE/SkfB family radical SAM enzyme
MQHKPPSVPIKFDTFPEGYINDINGWGFNESIIKANAGKLLTLDIDFGSRCSLNCPFCFRRNNSVDNCYHELQFDDLVKIVTEAKKLGLRSVKFLGAGEPLENPKILDFLRILKDLDVVPVIFSKTGVIGDDQAVSGLFSEYDIHTPIQLVKELYRCGCSIVIGFNSFDDSVQSQMIGNGHRFIEKRNKSIEYLIEAGFNSTNPTRLALGINPVTKLNYSDAFEIYKWARLRNIYAIVTPTMVSGRAKAWKSMNPSSDEIVKLYTDIYRFNIETKLMTLEQIRHEGVSAYAGGHPCNQVAAGLYITLNGVVLSCPGNEELVEGNIWDSSLKEIWSNSGNYTRRGTFNCHCIAKDGKTLPKSIYEDVLVSLHIKP